MQTRIFRYIWPEGDKTPWRIIQKPKGEKWGAFKILGSQILPVGDFDDGEPSLDEPHRVYRTHKGYRVFYTGRYDPNFDNMVTKMFFDGADREYVKVAKKRRYYASRIEPKYFGNFGANWAVTRLMAQHGEIHPAWDEFIEVHDNWTGAHSQDTVLL